MKKRIEIFMAAVLLLMAAIFAKEGSVLVGSIQADTKEKKLCIVIDAGHGGMDPGKVGINGKYEKDVNLEIAYRLKRMLEAEGIEIVLTRTDDNGLYQEESSNKKVEDMRKRCEIISETMPVFTISIHQNSYPEESIKGAQTFYYEKSEEGKILAETIQASMIQRLDKDNKRMAKSNESYYLLKRTPTPTVIVECGFLSNPEEADLLITKDYQERVAWSVHMGIMQYLNAMGK